MIKLYEEITTNLRQLSEADIQDLLNDSKATDPKRIHLSKSLYSEYKGVDSDGTLLFKTDSQTNEDLSYQQRIFYNRFFELLDKVDADEEITQEDVVDILTSDVYIDCDCPSHLYWGWAYKSWNNDYGLRKETRKPERNNVDLRGSICKHAIGVLDLINRSDTLLDKITLDLNTLFQAYKKRSSSAKDDGSV